ANISQKVFAKNFFGFFEQVRKDKFGKSYRGTYRHATGPEPFIRVSRFLGEESFADGDLFIVDSDNEYGLPLQPLIFWDECPHHPDLPYGHCYFYDKSSGENKAFSYKAAGHPCTIMVSEENKYGEIAKGLIAMKSNDPTIERTEKIKLQDSCIE